MKKTMSLFLSLLLVRGLLAVVIVDTNIVLQTPGFGNRYQIDIAQDPDFTDHTCNDFSWNNGDVTGNYCLDEGAEWFAVEEGDEFSEFTVGLVDPVSGVGFPDSQFPRFFDTDYSLSLGDEFFAAVATPLADFGDYPPTYGWAKFRVIVDPDFGDMGVEMVGNAMAYFERGIIVGTDQAIPEPSSAVLFTVALLCVFSRFRRK